MSDLNFTLQSAVTMTGSSSAPSAPIIRIRFQSLEPVPFLMHTVFATIAAVDAIVTYSCMTGSA